MPRVQNSSSFPFLESIIWVTLVTFLVTFDFSGPETLDFTDRYWPDIARSSGARPLGRSAIRIASRWGLAE